MKHQHILYSISIALVAGLGGCKKFVERNNVNINPNQPSTVTLNTLLPAVQNATASNYTNVAYITSMFSGQMAAYTSGPLNEDQNKEVRISTAYAGLYQNGMTNSKLLVELARAQGSPYYMAIGRILFVTNLALATDTWGDVPLSEAFQATEILYPKYDRQQDIYAFMHTYLDSAIAETAQANPTSLRPGIDDLIFGGTMDSWKQTAWFLKAKLYMHTTKKGAVTAANSALTALANAYTSSSKVFQLIYSDRNSNPWFTAVSGRISGSQIFTIGPSRRYLEALTGITYPGLFDPRVDTLIQRTGTNPLYLGIVNGGGNTNNNTNFTDVTFFGRRAAPLLMGSFAEQKLMEAEARFLANGGTPSSVGTTQAAYDAYIAGIAASLRYLGYDTLTSAKGKAYINLPQVKSSPATLTLELIMRERQVVLFLNPEAWVDLRRYDYNPNLFRGIALPLNQNPELGGNFIRRALYPTEEINRNPRAQEAIKPMTEKVWWDQ
jgi:hypothetical protein